MIGAIEILMIAIIFGIIYGRDAIDRTFKKHPDESVVESLADDLRGYYKEDPKRLFKLIALAFSIITFLGLAIYYAVTHYNISKLLGLDQ